jgi:hypothetical protein
MAKTSGLAVRCYLDGHDISGDVSAISNINATQEMLDVPNLSKEAMERLAGREDGNIAINTWFNPDTSHAAILDAGKLPAGDRVVLVPMGAAIGDQAAMLVTKGENYNVTRAPGSAIAAVSSFQANGVGVEFGEMLTATKRTDASAANGSSIDGGAQTTDGGVGYVQVFSLGSGSVTPVIQDSADDTSFAAITGLTFTERATAAVPVGERLATAAGATIRRYVRFSTTGTFTNAVVVCGFKRN